MNVNMHKITLSSHENIFTGVIEIKVHDRQEVKNVINGLKKVEGLQELQQIM